MSDPTLRTAGDVVHILAFAVFGGAWLIGGLVFAVYLLRSSLGSPAPAAGAAPAAATAPTTAA